MEKTMIPKIIHYCWFGGNPLPDLAVKCIASWKKYFSNYEIKEWNESNYDVHKIQYISEAYNLKKYAFVSDYARFDILYQNGGIFLDTDVELIRPFDDALLQDNCCFGGFEDNHYVNPGSIFAGEKGCTITKELMDFYSMSNFIQKNGKLNITSSPQILTNILLKHGLKKSNTYQKLGVFTAYPTEYFCPKDFKTGKLTITKNTYSIHHYDSSWYSEKENKSKEETWIFHEKYGSDAYLVDVFNKMKKYEYRVINFDIENMSTKRIINFLIKKFLRKIFGNKFTDKLINLRQKT